MTPELFEAITQWQQEKFPDATIKNWYDKLKEEIKEVGESQNFSHELKVEIADVLMVFFGLIHANGFTHHDITEAIANKFAIIRNQEFVFDEEKGVHRRVK